MANTPAHCPFYHDRITVKVTRLPAWGIACSNARSIQLSIDWRTNKTNGFGPSKQYYEQAAVLYGTIVFPQAVPKLLPRAFGYPLDVVPWLSSC